ncbi:MAG: hydratase [Pseudomonadota bacterium]
MTERGGRHCERTADRFVIGPSGLVWDGSRLVISVAERSTPFLQPVKGTITVDVSDLGMVAHALSDTGGHHWRPMNPSVAVEVDFDAPALSWRGRGYLDMNWGNEGLEQGFRFWDWSRFDLGGGQSAVLYRTDPRIGDGRQLAFRFDGKGGVERFESVDTPGLAPTRIWRIRRPAMAAASDAGTGAVRLVRTFEDTPFYSRSEVAADLFGRARPGVHESFDGNRLKRGVVKAMLPFRMPRVG